MYFFIKYFILFVFIMIKNQNFELLRSNNYKTKEDILYVLWLILFLPIIQSIIFSLPLLFSFRFKNPVYFVGAITLFIVIEYLVYIFLTSTKPLDGNGFLSAILSIALFILLFFKEIKLLLKQ